MLRTVLETYTQALEPVLLAPVRAAATGPLDEVFGLLASYRGRLVATDCTHACPLGRLALEIDPENTRAHRSLAPFDTCIGQLRLHLATRMGATRSRRPARRPSGRQVRR